MKQDFLQIRKDFETNYNHLGSMERTDSGEYKNLYMNSMWWGYINAKNEEFVKIEELCKFIKNIFDFVDDPTGTLQLSFEDILNQHGEDLWKE